MTRLTVVVPTLGRGTLDRTLASLDGQLWPHDELLVIADTGGDPGRAAAITSRHGGGRTVRFLTMPGGVWGQRQRNRGHDLARDGYVWAVADDDAAADGAVDAIHQRIDRAAGGWFLFRAYAPSWPEFGTVWRQPGRLAYGNLDAECIVAPAGCRARWGDRYEGDFDFAVGLQAELGDPAWVDEVIAVVRPEADA